ncbi:phospholipase D-like domain-containing protein [Spirosoma sp. SC4-14]|uniref:phospholipase D-like domain-containing protein n=1 Tax=Spirosoma sp. SC4-14 TaxID=3128900 RepID=UPI0030D220D1
MRTFEENQSLAVLAVAGTHVITLGMNLPQPMAAQLLGFSIQRTELAINKTVWLDALKVFQSVLPQKPAGQLVSTEMHPIQDFFWSDFTVRPGRAYRYRILARSGPPSAMNTLAEVTVDVTTEQSSDGESHEVYFNRGVAGSQAFVNRFGSGSFASIEAQRHDEVYNWLSRGLREAMVGFIQQATGPTFGLRLSVYEFSYEPVIQELVAARQRGVDVQIVVHAHADTDAERREVEKVRELVERLGLTPVTVFREHTVTISHNKFFVLLENNSPKAVWTGSTNLTNGGIHGHSNVGHVVRLPEVAKLYLRYWQLLHADTPSASLQASTLQMAIDPVVGSQAAPNETGVYFSPRAQLRVLDWYAEQMDAQTKLAFITVPFGLDKRFETILAKEGRTNPIYVVSDKTDPGLRANAIVKNPANQVAYGSMLNQLNNLEGWIKERLTPLNARVRYIHTKYLLLDPLGDDPVTISGSANFSESSVQKNDENMLVIRGDKRVADIYFGEFMRLFRHFYFRDLVTTVDSGERPDRLFLDETPAWTLPFYVPGSPKEITRNYFSGTL